MSKSKTLPSRDKVKPGDTWNLGALYLSDAAWEKAFAKWEKLAGGYARYKGHLADDAATLLACLQFDAAVDKEADTLGTYAFLKTAQDQADGVYQRMAGRYQHAAVAFAEASAFMRPELIAVPARKMDKLLADPALADWRLALERVLRYRPHTLTDGEEKLLAMQGQMAGAAGQIFRQLNDSDLKWPAIENEKGQKIELGHSSYSAFMVSPKRAVRKEAFHTFYEQFDAHKNTLAAALNGSNQRDVYYARARGYASAREASLFADNVPVKVYDNLVASVRRGLPGVHRYYALRQKAMKLKQIHAYDTYVPILSDLEKKTTWEQATTLVTDALAPLGDEYCRTLHAGLSSARWCDRYPNRGKRSGAFSSGTFGGLPYILMNYQPDVLNHVFTLAHEAGHSMHTWYSGQNQPFQYHNYTIFVAEVASTFNERLLAHHMLERAQTKKERAYLINMMIDDIRGTVVRQTMFAEFEAVTHALVERGEPLTVDTLRREYRTLLDAYFGPAFHFNPQLELECLRIPHFYSAFYVYKYATGLSAAIALSQKVLTGGAGPLEAYLNFLKGGSSQWPLDLLRTAGVDMAKPAPVDAAMTELARLVEELEGLM